MEEEVMPSFYLRSCINKNNFLLSFRSFSRKRKSKANLLLFRVGELSDVASKENALCICFYLKVWALSSQQKCKGLEQFGSLFPKLDTSSTGNVRDAPFQIHLQPSMRMNYWYCSLSQGRFFWRKMVSNLCHDSSTKFKVFFFSPWWTIRCLYFKEDLLSLFSGQGKKFFREKVTL